MNRWVPFRFDVLDFNNLRPETPVTPVIKRQMRRRSAIKPVIGHIKAEHRMAATTSPASTATPSTPSWPAAGYNFSSCLETVLKIGWLWVPSEAWL